MSWWSIFINQFKFVYRSLNPKTGSLSGALCLRGTEFKRISPVWCACWIAWSWGIWHGICGYLMPKESTATAGWTAVEITMRAFSVRKTLTRRTPRCAAGAARCATAARPRTRVSTRGPAQTTERWRTTRNMLPVRQIHSLIKRSQTKETYALCTNIQIKKRCKSDQLFIKRFAITCVWYRKLTQQI